MEFLVLFILPLGGYVVYLVCFADLRSTFEKQKATHTKGVGLYRAGCTQESIEYFQAVARKDKHPALALYYLSLCHQELGNQYQAMYYLQQCIRYDNTVADAYMRLGDMLMQMEAYEEAALEYGKASFYLKNDPEPLFRKGRCLLALKFKKDAKKCFQHAAKLGHEEANHLMRQQLLFSDLV